MKTIISTNYLKSQLRKLKIINVINIIIDSKQILFIDNNNPQNNVEITLSNTIGLSDTFYPNINLRIWDDLLNTLEQYYPNDEPITLEIYRDDFSNIEIVLPITLR